MFERSEFALKILCGAMGLLVAYRLVMAIVHINPLYHLAIPALPALTETGTTNTGGAAGSSVTQKKVSTNSVQVAAATLTNSATTGTNSSARASQASESGSNVVMRSKSTGTVSTNQIPATNVVTQKAGVARTGTNSISQPSHSIAVTADGKAGPALRPAGPGFRGPMAGGMAGMPRMGPELPPEVQKRIDRIVESEILAPVMRPLPMALLGIAGKDVFLRAPNGQTGLIKEGEELGGVKLVRIGVNRVLVEEQGERKELTIFAGLGSQPLLSVQKDSPK